MDFYGTIGPACADLDTLRGMVRAGMTGIRMNLSHGSLAEHAPWLALLREAGIRSLLIDLQGPELRVGRLAAPLSLAEGPRARAPFGRRKTAAAGGCRRTGCTALHCFAGRSAP